MTGTGGLALATRGLRKSYGSHLALAGLDLSVPKGTVYGFLGPNGAGKTTTMRLLTGLIRPDAGTIELLGRPFGRRDRHRLFDVGALIESPAFYPFLSGRQNLRELAATGAPVEDGRIEELLELTGLRDRAGDKVSTYSLGMKQRLGIAAALTNAVINSGAHLAGARFTGAGLRNLALRTTDAAGADFRAPTCPAQASAHWTCRRSRSRARRWTRRPWTSPSSGPIWPAPIPRSSASRLAPAEPGWPITTSATLSLIGFFFGGAGPTAVGDLQGADFRHADVHNLGFSNVDLTGARFPAGARSQIDFNGGVQIYFSTGVTCPDGKPATKVSFSYDCRLGK